METSIWMANKLKKNIKQSINKILWTDVLAWSAYLISLAENLAV